MKPIFGLSRLIDGWTDYFFIDKDAFGGVDEQPFIPTSTYRDLYAFSLFPKFTETTMVNFAMASGLLSEALELDDSPSVPVTGQSTYSFEFYPRTKQDGEWRHEKGQVEIDGAFTARKNGKDSLFIVEAKSGNMDSLAKTKLLYPYLSLRPNVPKNMPIYLVYLRASMQGDEIVYRVAQSINPEEGGFVSPIHMQIENAKCLCVKRP